ncbi:MAG: hypothetical protein JKX94_00335, partial [Sneathiella sp.]|nr:hypothetical protein [Sneathiella sp.]
GNDIVIGNDGADVFHYESIADGQDQIFAFDGVLDVINLDAVFDKLNIEDADTRAGMVNLDVTGGHTVITIDDQDGFSITLKYVDLGTHDGDLSAQDLMSLKNLMVSDES